MTKADVRSALSHWARESGCRLAVLFGSAADDRVAAPRDVDVALDYAEMPDGASRLVIVGELQELVDPRTVDVVFLHRDTSPVLLFEVFHGGRALFEAEPGLFVRGAVRAAALYDDALPFRRALRKSLRQGVSS
jgi:predicted nucleotidyltransferase